MGSTVTDSFDHCVLEPLRLLSKVEERRKASEEVRSPWGIEVGLGG